MWKWQILKLSRFQCIYLQPELVAKSIIFLGAGIHISVCYFSKYNNSNNGIKVNLVKREQKPFRKVHFSIALVLIFKVQLLKKILKIIRTVKVHLSLNLVTFLPILTVLLFIFIKKHMKNNKCVQNFEWMESSWSKLEAYVKRFDKYFMSLE